MTDALVSRGPDDEGLMIRPGVGLGHRRLSIIDLSAAARQPMSNEDENLWIVFNGAVYNFNELRSELEEAGHRFGSTSDTEVVLHAFEEWGERCLMRFNGMWALAIWDDRRRRLFCARDRFGKQPFHYLWGDGRFCFASEIKALLRVQRVTKKVNRRSAGRFLAFGIADTGDETFFEGIKRLPASHYAVLEGGTLTVSRYWGLDPNRRENRRDDAEAAEGFRELFDDAVRLRLISDVPLGATLSGGLDSSSIVVTAADLVRRPHRGERQLPTFSARFPGFQKDEGQYIDAVVKQTGVPTHQCELEIVASVDQYEDLLRCQDEPVLSSAMLANYKVMEMVHRYGIKVVLEGQGADEYLAGYRGMEHGYHADLLKSLRWVRLASELRAHAVQSRVSTASLLQTAARRSVPGIMRSLLGRGNGVRCDYLKPTLADVCDFNGGPRPLRSRFRSEMLSHLTYAYLPFYLRYGDRNAMNFGVETRLPFLDHRLVEYALALPDRLKINRAVRKYLLRDAMRSRLPKTVLRRTDKIGFQTPQAQWMRGPLRAKITEMFAGDEYRSAAYVDGSHVLAMWERFLEGDATLEQKVFRLFIFELWLRLFDLG